MRKRSLTKSRNNFDLLCKIKKKILQYLGLVNIKRIIIIGLVIEGKSNGCPRLVEPERRIFFVNEMNI